MNLATPTILTYTDTTAVLNCSVYTTIYEADQGPLEFEFITQWFVATVNGMGYPAENSVVLTQVVTTTDYLYNAYTFPGLTVTQLSPGEAITLVPPSPVPLPPSRSPLHSPLVPSSLGSESS